MGGNISIQPKGSISIKIQRKLIQKPLMNNQQFYYIKFELCNKGPAHTTFGLMSRGTVRAGIMGQISTLAVDSRTLGIVLHRDPKINFTRKKPDIFRVSRVWVKYFSGKSGSGNFFFLSKSF
jgi:hypothetical protein